MPTRFRYLKKESDIKEVLVWDSEKVYSGESVNIPYKGKQLASRERVYWKVRIWDERKMFLNGVRRLFLKPVY